MRRDDSDDRSFLGQELTWPSSRTCSLKVVLRVCVEKEEEALVEEKAGWGRGELVAGVKRRSWRLG